MRCHPWTITALLVMSAPLLAKGDGGIIRLREAKGPFSVTVFSPPEAAAGGVVDVSVLVQGRDTGKVLLDADVSFTLSPPDGKAKKQSDEICGSPTAAMNDGASVRATREQASNKLLYAAPMELKAPGNWNLHVLISRGPETARFDFLLPVVSRSGNLTDLWPYLALPPLAIAVFAANQWLRRQSLQQMASQM